MKTKIQVFSIVVVVVMLAATPASVAAQEESEDSAPEITDYSVTVDENEITVSFESDENLVDIEVDVRGPDGGTLTEEDFEGDQFEGYNAAYRAEANGEYTLELVTAEDSAGNDGTDTDPGQSFAETVTVDGAEEQTANVTLSNVTADTGQDEVSNITVDEAYLPEGGFVTIHDGTLLDGETLESVRGTSAYLEAGTNLSDVEVELDDPYTENGTAIAMAHRDTDDDETYDFVTSEGEEDGPYTSDDEAVVDSASVTVEDGSDESTPTDGEESTPTDGEESTPTDGEMDGEESTPTDGEMDGEETEDTDGDGAGFGPVLAIVALAGAAFLALRRRAD